MLNRQKTLALMLAGILGFNFTGCSKDSDTAAVVAAAAAFGIIADTYYTLGNIKLEIAAPSGVLINDSNVTQVDSADDLSANGGAVTMNLDGSFTYNPPLGFSGTDTFSYSVGSQTTIVSIIIENVVWFVKNDAAAGGDGTQAAPFDALADAESASSDNDFIFIYNGDGTNSNQASGITLKDGQKLIGEGVALQTSTGFELVAAGTKAVITNTAGNAVTLADDNEVKGLKIDSANNRGIKGSTISNVNIHHSEIVNSNSRAIEIIGSNGIFTFDNLTIDGNGGDGIHIESSNTDSVAVNISNSTVSDGSFDGICMGAFDTSAINATISMTEVSLYSDKGIEFTFANSATGTVNILSNSSSSDNSSDGLYFEALNSSNVELNVSNSTFNNNSSDGIQLLSSTSAILKAAISSNTINDNSGQGIDVDSNNSSVLSLTASSNSFDSNSSSGIELDSNNSSTLNSVLSSNTLTGNGVYGVEVDSNSTSQLCVDLASNSSDSDFRLDHNATSLFQLALGSNTGSVLTTGTIVSVAAGSCL